MSKELRSVVAGVNCRSADDAASYIDGYAAVFDSPTIIWDFEETIAPGAFSRALSEGQDVRTLFNHDSNYPLARTANGTLTLKEDSKGLWTESRVSSNPTSDSVLDYIKTGLVSGMSFSFTVRKQEWKFNEPGSGQLDRRIITEVGLLYDVGPVTYPAYEATSIKMRDEATKMHNEARSRYFATRDELGSDFVYKESRSEDGIWMLEVVEGQRDAELRRQQEEAAAAAKLGDEQAQAEADALSRELALRVAVARLQLKSLRDFNR